MPLLRLVRYVIFVVNSIIFLKAKQWDTSSSIINSNKSIYFIESNAQSL